MIYQGVDNMLKFNDIKEMKEKYTYFSNYWFYKIQEKGLKLGDDIKLKLQHGISMSDAVASTTLKSGFFNESYVESAAIDGLLHDVGRFPQYFESGTLNDADSKEFTQFDDHGRYGAYFLEKDNKKLLRYFIGDNTEYDEILTEVVREHTTIQNEKYKKDIKTLIDVFQNYDINEVLTNKDMIDKLIALKLLILREEDSLEILHKVKDELWKPTISSSKDLYIKDEVWDIFLNQGYINMNDLKSKGLWNANAGFLLRYSLIFNNVNFVGTLKTLVNDNIIDKIYEVQKNNSKNSEGILDLNNIDPRLKEARDYMNVAIKNLIDSSIDGKIITQESKQEAKVKTLNSIRKM